MIRHLARPFCYDEGVSEGSAKKALSAAALLTVAGLAIAATVHRELGGAMLLAGWGTFVFGLHRFGRAGSDAGSRP
jgi:hypothetical protein